MPKDFAKVLRDCKLKKVEVDTNVRNFTAIPTWLHSYMTRTAFSIALRARAGKIS